MPVGKGLNSYYVNETSIYQVDNGRGVMVMSYNSNDKDLSSAFAFAVVKEMAVGSRFNDNAVYQTTINGSTVWSIATSNNSTHDNIIISSHDKDLTLKIYNSIKYNNNNTNVSKNNSNNDTSDSKNIKNVNNDNNPIVGYLGDGTPVYKNDYAKLSEQEPIYNFNPRNPDEVEKIERDMARYDYDVSQGGGSSSGGGSSQGGGSSEGGGAAPT